MLSTVIGYGMVLGLTGLERLAEVWVSLRNARWSFERGGKEFGQGHYRVMVVLHTAFLVGCLAEVILFDRVFLWWLGVPMLIIAAGCQVLRWWCITTLGRQWNIRVIVVPGLGPVTGGPYRFLRHPNYLAVVIEGIALPMIHTAWCTAILFTVLNAIVLKVRIQVEEQALRAAA